MPEFEGARANGGTTRRAAAADESASARATAATENSGAAAVAVSDMKPCAVSNLNKDAPFHCFIRTNDVQR